MSQVHPFIGTAVWIKKENKYLLGMRAPNKKGNGTWCPPGGHLEMHESLESCARRETTEEAGIEINMPHLIAVSEYFNAGTGIHFVTMHFAADWRAGEPMIKEDEVSEWGWFAWDELPSPLFQPAQRFVDSSVAPDSKSIEFI